MRKKFTFLVLVLMLFVGSILLGQRQKRAPWEERSPAVGEKVPEVMVYDQNLNQIPFSNLYQDSLLVIQWGGCT